MGFFQFSYPLSIFSLFLLFLVVFALETIYFAYLFWIVSRKHGLYELEVVSYSFFALGVSSILLSAGFIYFYFYGTSETPLYLGPIKINFLPATYALYFASLFFWYTTMYYYARIGRNKRLLSYDYFVLVLGGIGILLSFLPWNNWMQEIPKIQFPTIYNPNPPLHIESLIRLFTSLALIVLSFITLIAFFAFRKQKIKEKPDNIVMRKRIETIIVGLILLMYATVSVSIRDIAYLTSPEILPTPIMTLLISVVFLSLASVTLYIGLLAPEWAVKRWTSGERR